MVDSDGRSIFSDAIKALTEARLVIEKQNDEIKRLRLALSLMEAVPPKRPRGRPRAGISKSQEPSSRSKPGPKQRISDDALKVIYSAVPKIRQKQEYKNWLVSNDLRDSSINAALWFLQACHFAMGQRSSIANSYSRSIANRLSKLKKSLTN